MRPIVAVAAAAVLAVSGLTAVSPFPASAGVNTWDPPTTISALGEGANEPQVATDGTTITAVWQRFDGINTRIEASSSVNGGITWSAPVYLSPFGQDAAAPQLATDGSTITAVWQRYDGSNTRIQASSSSDAGITWSAPVTLSEPGQSASGPQVAAVGSTVTAIWSRAGSGNGGVQASSSINAGLTWSAPVDVSAAGQFAAAADVVTDGRTITAVWQRSVGGNSRIEASSSGDKGIAWSTPVSLSGAGQSASGAQLVTDGSTITAVWHRFDGANDRVQASSSRDAGTTWSTPVDLSAAGQYAYQAQLVTDGRTRTAVWSRFDGSSSRVQSASSDDSGATWSTPVTLSTAGQNASGSQLVTDGNTITAVWSRFDGSRSRAQASWSSNGGTTWSTPVDLSAAGIEDAVRPQLTIDGSTITAIWSFVHPVINTSEVQVSSLTSPREPGRLAGANRYLTAVEISEQFPANVPVVYLAAGTNFPDALSASSAAAVQDGPLLLTDPAGLPDGVGPELQRLNPDEVVIAGGTSAVSEAVRAQVQELLPSAVIRRDSGDSRYATSRALAANAFSSAPMVFVATGANFPDALSASAAAGAAGAPVILIDGAAVDIDQPTRDLFTQLGTTTVIIAGGSGPVRAEFQTALDTLFGPTNVTRLSGDDRYATGVAINQARFVAAPSVFLATGTGVADALAGAALAGRDKGPLYVVPGTCVPTSVLDELSRLKVNRVTLFGGTSVLTPAVQTLTPC